MCKDVCESNKIYLKKRDKQHVIKTSRLFVSKSAQAGLINPPLA